MISDGLCNVSDDILGQLPAFLQKAVVDVLCVKVAICDMNRCGLVSPGLVLAVVDGGVKEPMLRVPDDRSFPVHFVVAQLKAGKAAVLIVPDDKVEIARGKPAPALFAGDLSYLEMLSHEEPDAYPPIYDISIFLPGKSLAAWRSRE